MHPSARTVGPILAGLLATSTAAPAADEPWTAELQGGGTVRVDPATNRPTVTIEGRETQLWNGVHQLEDGRQLTVESGRVVPNQQILQAREPWPEPAMPEQGRGQLYQGPSPCQQLVDKVCGADGACAGSNACGPARQLRDMEREAQQRAGTPRRTTFTSDKCTEALADDFFAPCEPGTAPE